jgi:DNA-directed RNA polymerase specialized sigma24 family protein
MLSIQARLQEGSNFMAQSELPPAVMFQAEELDLWPYRVRTGALLRRYARASVEVGRVPSLLGREFFRSRVTSYSMGSFEDVVIFVTDMERMLDKLDTMEKKLIAMYVFEEYTISEISRLLHCCDRTVERRLHEAIDTLSSILLNSGLLERLPIPTRGMTQERDSLSDVTNSQ